MLEQLSSREKKLGLFTAGLVSIILFHSCLIRPLFSKFWSLREEIRVRSILLAKYTRVMQHQDLIRKIYDDYLEKVKGGGTAQEEISKFLQEVDQLCQKSGVHIVDIKPLGTKESGFFRKVRLEIEVDAQQVNLGKFLFELKISEAIIHVDNLKINTGSSGEDLKCYFILSRIIA